MSEPTNSLRTIFAEALEITDAQERDAYLAKACGTNVALRREVEELIQANALTGAFLPEQPAAGGVGAALVGSAAALGAGGGMLHQSPLAEKLGDRIGRFKLLQQIGEGGCGVVYMAEQEEPVRRRVALKIIKLGMDTRSVIARFEAERQVLALMDHPNIAKVLDGGATDTGRPYFVMELVKGIPITRYCDENKLDTRKRLDLFIQVCQAVQHAHQKGIIHRDIKPSNIMVADHDGVPVPKVIDFGVAKATAGQNLTDKTLFTAFEQFIGTPAYMSPEQAKLSGLDIDTRSDIYSLGVLLYELLTGKPPFDAKRLVEAGLEEICRIIREEEPPRPSTRLSTLDGEERTTVARQRQCEPPKLAGLIRDDLDWIVMKTLEKDRNRRYETANGLAADLRRFLSEEPIVARPPSQLYRFQKLIRRNKLAFGAVGAVAAALIVGLSLSLWLFIKEQAARRRAVAAEQNTKIEARKSQQVAQFLKDMLKSVGPSVAKGRDSRMLREILDKTAERAEKDLKDQPTVEAELREILGDTYSELEDYPKAEEMHRRGLELLRTLYGETNQLVAAALHDLGLVLRHRRKLEEAESVLREALSIRRALFGNENLDVSHSLGYLAGPVWDQGRPDEAIALLRQALAISIRITGGKDANIALGLGGMGSMCENVGRLSEAEEMYGQSLAMQRKLFGNESPSVASALVELARVLWDEGKQQETEKAENEALALYKKLLSSGRPDRAADASRLGMLLQRQGRLPEAEAIFRAEATNRMKLFGDEHASVARMFEKLASVLMEEGKPAEAEVLLRQLLARQPKSIDTLHRLISALQAQGKLAETEAIYRGAIPRFEKLATDSPSASDYWRELARNHNQLGTLMRSDGRKQEAEVELRKAHELWQKHPDPAIELAKKSAETQPKETAPYRWGVVVDMYYNAGDWENCLWAINKKEQVLPAMGWGPSGWEWFSEAMAYWQLNNRQESRRWFYKAIDWMDEAQENRLRGRQTEAAVLLGLPDPGERSTKASTYLKQANAHEEKGEMEKAKEAYGQAIGQYETLVADFPLVPAYQRKLVDLLTRTDRQQEIEKVYRQAESAIRDALAARRKLPGNGNQDMADLLEGLARLLQVQGRRAEAAAVSRERLENLRAGLASDDPRLGDELATFTATLLVEGNFTEAEVTAHECLSIRQGAIPDGWQSFNAQVMLGASLLGQKKYVDAEPNLVSGYEGLKARADKIPSASKPRLKEALHYLVQLCEANERPDQTARWKAEGTRLYREEVEIFRKASESGNPQSLNGLAWLLATCADAEIRDGRSAVTFAEKAVAATKRKDARIMDTLAAAYAEAGEFERAVSAQKEAIALLPNDVQRKEFRLRLELYEAHSPYRQTN